MGIHRINSGCKRKEKWIALLKMPGITHPFARYLRISAFQIPCQMLIIRVWQVFQSFLPKAKLFTQVKNCTKKVGKTLVFEKIGIFKKLKHKRSLAEKKITKLGEMRLVDFNLIREVYGLGYYLFKILFSPF